MWETFKVAGVPDYAKIPFDNRADRPIGATPCSVAGVCWHRTERSL
jgi:hypothetical protein